METTPSHRPPRIAANGTALGLVVMAFFTVMWSANTLGGWPASVAVPIVALAVAGAALFIVQAVRLLRARSRFPAELSPQDQERAKRQGGAYGMIFGIEGVAIFVAVGVLNAVGAPRYIVPIIAMIVGLHFYPMARVFRRRLDLYPATWASLVGLAGVLVLATTSASTPAVWAWVGLGAAVATGGYGAAFTVMTSDLLRQVR